MTALGRATASAKSLAKAAIKRRLLAGRFRSVTTRYGAPTGREVPVLMCLWNRPGRIVDVLRQLDGQDAPDGIDLLLWNNNRLDHDLYRDAVAAFAGRGALRSVSLVESPFNLGSIGRFYWARKLALAGRTGPVVVIDDDEDFGPDFISICLRSYAPKIVSGWWAFAVGRGYYEREPSVVGGRVDHVGPGGMVCNVELFTDPEFFRGLPEKYWLLDDLWFTWFVKQAGCTLAKLPVDIEFVLPETNQHHTQGNLKHEFFNYLYNGGK